ncbi:uncharacterized protein LOC120695155 [Panicum virgatum]|uniref:uncharacterized protein LOC120695155 n=1 Tax=Panicum virgatum TaxID=38727 RepID=UPI0019D5A9EC|nr:uncharacterized protein LOC120695155 [Panicum virgatum]
MVLGERNPKIPSNPSLITFLAIGDLSSASSDLLHPGAPVRTLIHVEEQPSPLPAPAGTFPPGSKMEPWMIDMLAGNGGGSHDLEMHGTNAGGNHDVQVVETQHGSPQEEQVFREGAVVEATTGVKGNKKRSKNFSVKEDNLLVAAWLEISMDVVQGIDQPRATYWERIHEHYHLHKDFETDRNCGSLAHRWGIILEAVNKFCSWYGHVQRRQESGLTEQDC